MTELKMRFDEYKNKIDNERNDFIILSVQSDDGKSDKKIKFPREYYKESMYIKGMVDVLLTSDEVESEELEIPIAYTENIEIYIDRIVCLLDYLKYYKYRWPHGYEFEYCGIDYEMLKILSDYTKGRKAHDELLKFINFMDFFDNKLIKKILCKVMADIISEEYQDPYSLADLFQQKTRPKEEIERERIENKPDEDYFVRLYKRFDDLFFKEDNGLTPEEEEEYKQLYIVLKYKYYIKNNILKSDEFNEYHELFKKESLTDDEKGRMDELYPGLLERISHINM